MKLLFLSTLIAFFSCVSSLRQVAYISSTTLPEGLTHNEIEEILYKCRRYNSAHGITGILLYHQVSFFQIIEGDAAEIDKVLIRIETDPRHRGLIILHDKMVESRTFGKWSMMFRDLKYTTKIEEMGQQTEHSLLKDITQIGSIDTPATSDIASRKALKLLAVYKRLILDQ